MRRPARGRGRAELRLRAVAAQPPRHRRPEHRTALQGRAQFRAHGEVLRRRRVDDRARDQGAEAPGSGPRAPGAGERAAAGGAARAVRLLASPRHEPRDARSVRTGDAGGADQYNGADPRRVRDRQRADRAGHPLQLAALGPAVRQGELRGAARHAHRVGAVRLRERRVHRRAWRARPGGSSGPTAARCSSTRLATSTRRPGEAAARPAGTRIQRLGGSDRSRSTSG